jgi:hypothetical protein
MGLQSTMYQDGAIDFQLNVGRQGTVGRSRPTVPWSNQRANRLLAIEDHQPELVE